MVAQLRNAGLSLRQIVAELDPRAYILHAPSATVWQRRHEGRVGQI
jgi:hypothetical protein